MKIEGLTDLLASERGVFAIALFVTSIILLSIGVMDVVMWEDFVKWVAITLIASKTLTTAVDLVMAKKPTPPAPPTPPGPAPAAKPG